MSITSIILLALAVACAVIGGVFLKQWRNNRKTGGKK